MFEGELAGRMRTWVAGMMRPAGAACLLLSASAAFGQEGGTTTVEAAAAPRPFTWSWEKEVGGASGSDGSGRGRARGTDGVSAEAYGQLLRENLELRRRIEAMGEDAERLKKENAGLLVRVRELEEKRETLASSLRTMRASDEIELELDAARAAAASLRQELDGAKSETARLQAENIELRRQAEGEGAEGPARDSALYRRMEQENLQLRDQTARLRAARELEEKAYEQISQERRDLRDETERLSREKAQLEAALEKLRAAEALQKEELLRRNEELARQKERAEGILEEEIARRERQLSEIEADARNLKREKEKVEQGAVQAQRDMYFNMGVLYARNGQNRDALDAFREALDVTPDDADIHYNLGVLYETAFGDRDRAARHYRKYVELNPYGRDVDLVRSWIVELEMRQ